MATQPDYTSQTATQYKSNIDGAFAATHVSVASVSDLRSGSFGGDKLWLSGYYGVGTAGGGPLYRDSDDTTTADNGGTVFVDADGVRWKRPETDLHSVAMFGAKGDGSTDDTDAIQGALDAWVQVEIPKTGNPYMIRAADGGRVGIKPNSGNILSFEPGAEFKAIGNDEDSYSIINLRHGPSDITLLHPIITGERNEHTGTTGEFGMGIDCLSVDGLYVLNGEIRDCWGDGLYLGSSGTPNKNILLMGLDSHNNRRQGMSVISVNGIYGENVTLRDTNGTGPGAGIDFEPNANDEELKDIKFDNLLCKNNEGEGCLIFLTRLCPSDDAGAIIPTISMEFNNLRTSGNGGRGIGVSRWEGEGYGHIVFNSPIMESDNSNGFAQRVWGEDGPKVTLNNPTVINPNRGGLSALAGAAFAVNRETGEGLTTENTGHLDIVSPKVYRDPDLTHANTVDLITRDDEQEVTRVSIFGELESDFDIDNASQHRYNFAPLIWRNERPVQVQPREQVITDFAFDTGQNNMLLGGWSQGSVSSGTGQSFDTGISAANRRTRLVLISSRRSGTARIDSFLRLFNTGGAAGSDEDFDVATSTNLGGLSSVSLSTSVDDTIVLNADVDNDLAQLSVSVVG